MRPVTSVAGDEQPLAPLHDHWRLFYALCLFFGVICPNCGHDVGRRAGAASGAAGGGGFRGGGRTMSSGGGQR